MTSITLLIYLAMVAWLAQILLGWWQIKVFNQALNNLCYRGRVSIGRSIGRFRSRIIIVLSFDETGHISDGFILKGCTVFARPVKLVRLIGLNKDTLDVTKVFPQQPASQTALTLAIQSEL